MTILTFTEAARAAGVARSTLYRRVKNGGLNSVERPDGTLGIAASELARVYTVQTDMSSRRLASGIKKNGKTGIHLRFDSPTVDIETLAVEPVEVALDDDALHCTDAPRGSGLSPHSAEPARAEPENGERIIPAATQEWRYTASAEDSSAQSADPDSAASDVQDALDPVLQQVRLLRQRIDMLEYHSHHLQEDLNAAREREVHLLELLGQQKSARRRLLPTWLQSWFSEISQVSREAREEAIDQAVKDDIRDELREELRDEVMEELRYILREEVREELMQNLRRAI
jgi:hypothetical protein